jgi:hypothetical protein
MKTPGEVRLNYRQMPVQAPPCARNVYQGVVTNATLSFTLSLAIGVLSFLLLVPSAFGVQKKSTAAKPKGAPAAKPKAPQTKPVDELAKLRDEFIKASSDYQALLKKQLPGLETNVARAQDQLTKLSQLFAEGLISKKELEASERALGQAKDKVTEINQAIANADSRIADTLLEAEAESTLAKVKPIPRGGMVSTAAMIRFNGGAPWALSDAWKVQRFFLEAFKKPLPIAVFGQGAIHDRWRLDHRNAMDVSLHPDGPEGQALLDFLRKNGIPFLAFRQAIPGTATGPHIHIGRPSHRY